LAAYIDNFVARFEFIGQVHSQPDIDSFWLSAFFFPQGFLTTLLQAQSRKFNCPIDDLTLNYFVMSMYDINECPEPEEN
jgi:dynein heavy chain